MKARSSKRAAKKRRTARRRRVLVPDPAVPGTGIEVLALPGRTRAECEAIDAEAEAQVKALEARGRISRSETLKAGQTHAVEDVDGRRRLVRKRFSAR